jgi:transcriptional regulator with GAF, ATPase, and Fis domain
LNLNEDIKLSFEDEINAKRRKIIEEALLTTSGNISQAAKILKLHRNNVVRWMQVLGIKSKNEIEHSLEFRDEQRKVIEEAIVQASGNVSEAARQLHIPRGIVDKRIHDLGIKITKKRK